MRATLAGTWSPAAATKRRNEPENWTYERILAERGPVREVIAPVEADLILVQTALERAGHLAAGSLTVALHPVTVRHRSSDLLVAGDPKSLDSEELTWIASQTGSRLEKHPHR